MYVGGGGKALTLASLGCHVTCWDIRPQALRNLVKRAYRCGLEKNITVLEQAPVKLPADKPYDLVLVDAPCSGIYIYIYYNVCIYKTCLWISTLITLIILITLGTGVLRRHPENRWKLQYPLSTQQQLLTRALHLSPQVLYATCALNAEENEQLVRRVSRARDTCNERNDEIDREDSHDYHVGNLEWEETIWPEKDGADGFYMAGLTSTVI